MGNERVWRGEDKEREINIGRQGERGGARWEEREGEIE